jgi:hypothetical protein
VARHPLDGETRPASGSCRCSSDSSAFLNFDDVASFAAIAEICTQELISGPNFGTTSRRDTNSAPISAARAPRRASSSQAFETDRERRSGAGTAPNIAAESRAGSRRPGLWTSTRAASCFW